MAVIQISDFKKQLQGATNMKGLHAGENKGCLRQLIFYFGQDWTANGPVLFCDCGTHSKITPTEQEGKCFTRQQNM